MRKNVMIIAYDKDDYPPSEESGIMKLEHAGAISNQDDLVAAMLDNSPFVIDLKHVHMRRGTINPNGPIQEFRLDFFDDYRKDPYLEDYLASDEADYRATRLSDGTIIRLSNEDYKRYLEKEIDLSDAPTHEFSFERELEQTKAPAPNQRNKFLTRKRRFKIESMRGKKD